MRGEVRDDEGLTLVKEGLAAVDAALVAGVGGDAQGDGEESDDGSSLHVGGLKCLKGCKSVKVFECLSVVVVVVVVVVVFDDEKRFDLKTGMKQIFIFDKGTLKGYIPLMLFQSDRHQTRA